MSRNQQLALTAIANQFAMEMFDAQVDADSQKSMGALVGNMMQSVFSGVINQTGIFSGDDDAGDSGFPEFPDLEDETGILFDD